MISLDARLTSYKGNFGMHTLSHGTLVFATHPFLHVMARDKYILPPSSRTIQPIFPVIGVQDRGAQLPYPLGAQHTGSLSHRGKSFEHSIRTSQETSYVYCTVTAVWRNNRSLLCGSCGTHKYIEDKFTPKFFSTL
jgi:hypothetical protein